MSGYDGAEFLARVQAHWAPLGRRTMPTGCYVCDVVVPSLGLTRGEVIGAQRRCRDVSGGIVDAHHLLPRQVLKRELPHGVYTSLDGAVIPCRHSEPVDERIRGTELDPTPRLRSVGDLLMDPRNGIVVRRYHHDVLENSSLAIPVKALPAGAREFAEELGLMWWFENNEARRAGARREW